MLNLQNDIMSSASESLSGYKAVQLFIIVRFVICVINRALAVNAINYVQVHQFPPQVVPNSVKFEYGDYIFC
jgi:hypothetical protein